MEQQNSTLLDTAERRRAVLRLRKAGATYRDIAETLRQQYTAERLPSGWDERYAAKDVKRELQKVRAANQEEAESIRDMELGRLDSLQRGLWQAATDGDTDAARTVLKVMKRRAALLGLDAPERLELDGKVNVLELRAVIIGALEGYPEARLAVADALSGHAEEADLIE